MIASSKRNIKSGSNYNQYFNLNGVQGKEVTLLQDGGVEQTIAQMKKIVQNTLAHTGKLAPVLKGATTLATSRNIWNFVYNHIQYKKDHPLREQLRTPLRTWKDRGNSQGVDCDCYSIFISSLLSSMKPPVPHSFRIAAYKADYQHVYVVVPDGGKEIIIDCVADSFNQEVPWSKKKDFTVMNGTSLNGLGACRSTQPAVVYMSRERLEKRGYVFTTDVLDKHGIAYTEAINENGNVPEIHTVIGGKHVVLPTAITQARAKSLMEQPAIKAPRALSGTDDGTTKKILTGLGIGALLYFFFTGDESKPGMAGPGQSPARVKIGVVKI